MFRTIIYANCKNPLANGDFSFAGQVAFAVQSYFNENNINNSCMFASLNNGHLRFQKLYPVIKGTIKINCHGLAMECVDLHNFMTTTEASNIVNFIQIGCYPAPAQTLKVLHTIAPNINYMFLALPNWTHDILKNRLNQYNGLPIQIKGSKLGISDDSLGVSIYFNKAAALNPNDYYNLINDNYAFSFVPQDDITGKFIGNFLRIHLSKNTPITNFIFIDQGNLLERFHQLDVFANKYSKSIKVYNAIEENAYIVSDEGMDASIDCTVLILKAVPHMQVKPLIERANVLTGATGAGSFLEMLKLGKIPYCYFSFNSNNQPIFADYEEKLEELINILEYNEEYRNNIILFRALYRNQNFSEQDMACFAKLLADRRFIYELVRFNQSLFLEPVQLGEEMVRLLTSDRNDDNSTAKSRYSLTNSLVGFFRRQDSPVSSVNIINYQTNRNTDTVEAHRLPSYSCNIL